MMINHTPVSFFYCPPTGGNHCCCLCVVIYEKKANKNSVNFPILCKLCIIIYLPFKMYYISKLFIISRELLYSFIHICSIPVYPHSIIYLSSLVCLCLSYLFPSIYYKSCVPWVGVKIQYQVNWDCGYQMWSQLLWEVCLWKERENVKSMGWWMKEHSLSGRNMSMFNCWLAWCGWEELFNIQEMRNIKATEKEEVDRNERNKEAYWA